LILINAKTAEQSEYGSGLRIDQLAAIFPAMSRGEPTKTIGHARAGGEKALTSIASAATIRR
jgi:hypothetical protein